MTVSTPFSAPAWPPDTGASRKPTAARRRGRRAVRARPRRGRRVVDVDRARLHAGERAVLAERHLAQIVVIADAGEDEIGALGRLGGVAATRRHAAPTHLLGLGAGAVVDGQSCPPLCPEMPGHRDSP